MTQQTGDELFQTALAHHQQGRAAEALEAYQRLIPQYPDHAEGLHLYGVLLGMMGRSDAALEMLRRAVAVRPDQAMYHHNLGVALQGRGMQEDAIGSFREAVRLNPEFPQTHYNLAVSLSVLGRLDEAIAFYLRTLQLAPDHAEAYCNLGVILQAQGRLDEAMGALRRALEIKPDLLVAQLQLGRTLLARGQIDEAIAWYQRALYAAPANAEVENELGVALQRKGNREEAIQHYRRAAQLQPGFAEAHQNLGSLLREKGQLEEASFCLMQAIGLKPGLSEAHHNLGCVYQDSNQLDESIASYQRAVELDPAHAYAWNNLGMVLVLKDRLDEAIAAYQQAIRLRPDFAQAHNNLGIAVRNAGDHKDALAHIRRAKSFEPANAAIHSNLIFAMNYEPMSAPGPILEECARWNERHAKPLKAQIKPHTNDRSPDRRLRIGYVSPDFRLHPVALNLVPLFSAHDHERHEIFCYNRCRQVDPVTALLRSHADTWRDIVSLSSEQVTQMVRDDHIDILVDLALHSAGGDLLLFARKPAPIQVCFAGYPGTTGVEAIDYRFTDPHLDPAGLHDGFYSEQSVRLPDSFWCYDPLTTEPPVNDLPALRTGHVTWGCLGNFSKVSAETIELWSQVLKAVPTSRLTLLAPRGSARQRVLDRVKEHGIDAQRLEFVDRRARAEYLKLFHQIDVGLDTLPYNGHTTSLDSYWMGVPVITLPGELVVGRAGVSQLMNLGLPELIARTPQQFAEIAARLASDLPRLAELRSTLRQRMQKSPLIDGPRFARGVEAAYRKMWMNWSTAAP